MSRTSFSTIRQALEKHEHKALLSLIGELHALNQENRDFLEARFGGDGIAFSRYKKIIAQALNPDSIYDKISFRDAKKAIADYRKAEGDPARLAELLVHAAECGNEFTCQYGDIGEPFYNSLERMFAAAADAVVKLEPSVAAPLIARLETVVNRAHNIGWGYYDGIADKFQDTF